MASNTLEMYLNGNYLVPHFEGVPDMWCTKPPILLWLQLGFMKLFGIGELAIRLPSAISGLAICWLLLFWGHKLTGSYFPGVLASLFLMISEGFVGWHGVRTGDYDILLSLATTFYLLQFQNIHASTEDKMPRLWPAFIGVVMAFWIKGVAGLLFLPVVFVFLLISQRKLVVSKSFVLSTLLSVFLALSYYFIRESLNPGYIKTVYDNEIGGRLLHAVEGHQHPFPYYFSKLPQRFGWWVWLVLPATFYLYSRSDFRRFVVFTAGAVSSYLLIVSIAQTKLPWYDLPVYPLIALLMGLGIWLFFEAMLIRLNGAFLRWLSYGVVLALFLVPYRNMIQTTFKPKEYSWDQEYYRLSYYLRDQIRKEKVFTDHILIDTLYCAHNKFYMNWMNVEGSSVDFAHRAHYARTGESIIAHQESVHQYIRSRYEYTILDSFHNVKVYQVGSRKLNSKAVADFNNLSLPES